MADLYVADGDSIEPDYPGDKNEKIPNHLALYWIVKRLEDRVEELADQLVLLEARPAAAADTPARVENQNEYCAACGSVAPHHFEDAAGNPCLNAAAEIAA